MKRMISALLAWIMFLGGISLPALGEETIQETETMEAGGTAQSVLENMEGIIYVFEVAANQESSSGETGANEAPESGEETYPVPAHSEADEVKLAEIREKSEAVEAETADVQADPENGEVKPAGPRGESEAVEAEAADAQVEQESGEAEPAETREEPAVDAAGQEEPQEESAAREGKLENAQEDTAAEPEETVPTEAEIAMASLNSTDDAGQQESLPAEAGAAEEASFENGFLVVETVEPGASNDEATSLEAASWVDVQVSDVKVTSVDTNDQYSTLSFRFSSGGREYICVVTGLEQTGANSPLAWQNMAEDIARSFLAGDTYTISDQTASGKYGLNIDLIDAEKTDKNIGADHYICWAASAADMMEFAGWNADESGNTDEDDIYREFREEFSDLGGYQTMGIGWYVDGVNPYQYTYQASGEIAYEQNLDHGTSQQQHSGTGGYWKDYAAALISPDTGIYEDIIGQLETAADLLEDGYAVGIGVYFYRNNGQASGGHALTVFGFVREIKKDGTSELRALFISDSDDRASGEITAPENRPNEYVMYTLGTYENGAVSAVTLENYPSALRTVIGIVSTLQPRKTAKKETEGTKDATRNPNLVPLDLQLTDVKGMVITTAEAGSLVRVETDFENQSYQALPVGSRIRFRVDVYRDGELVDQLVQTVTTEGLRPNRGIVGSVNYIPPKAGEYRFSVEVLEITDATGKQIKEAYLTDNQYQGLPRKLTVTASSGQGYDPHAGAQMEDAPAKFGTDEMYIEDESIATGGKEIEAMMEKIYELMVILATDTEYVLAFEADAASPESFRPLRNRATGETVAPEEYHITEQDDGYLLTFEEDLIRSLNPGRNDFILPWEDGQALIRVTLH